MSFCPPRTFKTRTVPTALCTRCQGVTPFMCVECKHPHCASCLHQYTGLCAPCCIIAHERRQDQTSLQGRHNAHMWAFWDAFMVLESDHLQ